MALSPYERWKQSKKQENTQQASQPAATQTSDSPYERWRKKKQEEAQAALAQQANSLLEGSKSLRNQYTSRYQNGNDTYRSDSKDYLDSVTAQRTALRQQADDLQAVFGQNWKYLDRDFAISLAKAVSGEKRTQNAILRAAEQDHEYWSQFDSEDAWNQHKAQQAEYEAKSTFYLDAGTKEVEDLKIILEEAESLQRQIAAAQNAPGQGINSGASSALLKKRATQMQERLDEITAQYGSIEALREQHAQRSQYLNQARHIQNGIALSGVAQNDDFRQYSGYVSTKSDDWWSGLTTQYGMGYADLTYEYINNQNGIRDEIKQKQRTFSSDNPFDDGESPFEEKGYDYLTENEIAIYNYHYAKDGPEAAEKYLNSIQETLNQRKATGMYEQMEGNTALEMVFGVAAGTDQFKSGMKNLFNTDDDYIAQTAMQIASGMVREDLADDGFKLPDWMGGASIGQVGYDAITTTANMAPSILTSMAVGMINPVAGEVVGTGLMGASAAGSAYQEMLNAGYSKDQARLYSAMVGSSEAGLQYLLGGIGKLGGKLSNGAVNQLLNNVDNAIARTAIQLGGNMLSEGFEEGLQEVLTPWFQSIVTGEEFEISSADVLYSSLLGALTTGFLEGPSTISGEVNTYKAGQQLRAADISAQRLAELGSTFAADTVAHQLAGRVDENTGAYTIGRLFNEIGATLTEQNKSDITSALVAEGMDSNHAKVHADVMAYIVEGGELSGIQMRIIQKNDVLAKVMKEVIIDSNSTVNQRTMGYNEALMALAQEKNAPDASRTEQALPGRDNAPASDTVDTTGEDGTQSHYEASADGKTILKSTGETVKIKEIATIKDGQMTLKMDDGSTVNAHDVSYASQDEALIYETVAEMGVNASAANVLVNAYHPGSGVNASAYSFGIKEAYRYGQYSYPVQEVANGPFSSMLTEHQRQTAYKLGQMFGGKEVAKAQATVSKKEKVATAEESSVAGKKGGVYYGYDGQTMEKRKASGLNEQQRVGVDFAERLAKSRGMTIYFYESYTDKAENRVYKNRNGEVVDAPNGFYDPKDGSIHIDLNAGEDGQGTVLFTIAHELTHFIKDWSPKHFKKLANILMRGYGNQEISVDQLVSDQQEDAQKDGRELSYDEAYEEVIADSMQGILADGKVMEMMRDLEMADKTLADKVREFFRDILVLIRDTINAYKNVSPESVEANATRRMTDLLGELEQVFAEGVYDGGENYRRAEKNTTSEGGVKMQARVSAKNPRYLDPRTVTKNDVLEMLNGVAQGKYQGRTYVPIRISTPGIVQERLFVQDRPMAMPVSKVAQAMKDDLGPQRGKNIRGHGFSAADIVKIAEKMDSPDYLYSQDSNDRGIAVIKHETSDGSVAVIVDFDCNVNPAYLNGYEAGAYNIAVTSFNIDGGMVGLFRYAQENGWREVFNKEKEGDPAKKFPATRPFAVEQDSLNVNVSRTGEEVKKKFSARDDAYKDAVNRGDMVMAQKMVDEAARKAGYTIKAYHGTDADSFYVYDKGKIGEASGMSILGDGFYFADKKDVAAQYGKNVHAVYLKQLRSYAATSNDAYKLNAVKLEAGGYDGVKLPTGKGTVYMVLDPAQIKSAEPVTYTDAGDVIPLSERFDSTKDDIRYSHRGSALKHFGRTYNWRETGYLLTDGSKLDFSGRHEGASGGYRTVDHRDILAIYPEDTELDGNGAMVDFMRQGNIRIMPEGNGINLQVQPTKAQEQALDHFISRARGEVALDIDDEHGNTIVSMEYPVGTRATKVLQDIRNYFENGTKPVVSDLSRFYYSVRKQRSKDVTEVLTEENAKLRDDVSRLKELLKLQRTVTGGTKFTKTSVAAAARVLKQYAGAKGDTKELAGMLEDFYGYIAAGEELTWEGVKEQARPVVMWLQDHVQLGAGMSEYARDILADLRSSRIYLDESQQAEAAHLFGSFNEYRKRAMGSIIIAKEGSMSLDSKWHELSTLYPDVFDADMTATDMPGALLNIIDSLRNSDTSALEYEYNRELIAQDLLRQVYDSYWRVSTLRTFADTKQAQINRLKGEHIQRMSKLRTENQKRLEQIKQQHRAEIERMRKEYRKNSEKKQQEIISRYQESRKKGIESRNKTAMRHKIQNVVSELNQYLLRGTKDRHIPIELQKAVAMALDAVNMDTVGAEQRIAKLKEELLKAKTPEAIQEISRKIDNIQAMGDRMNSRLQALKDAYDKFVNSDDPLIANSHDEVISAKLESVIETVGDTPLRDMTLSQLEDVYDMYRMVLTTIRNANKAFKAKKSESIAVLGDRVMKEVRQVGGKKAYRLKGTEGLESFDWNNLKPVYAFERIGSGTLTEIFNNVRTGEDVWATDVTEAREYYLGQSKKHHYDSWDFDKRYQFASTSGMNFELGLEQIMSLYAYSKRDQAAEHLKRGGIVFDETTEVTMESKLGIPLKFNPTEATAYNLSDETLADIISKLTPEQKAFVDEMQEYLSSTMGAKGNEVSLALYGIKLFKEKFYFPLKSATQFMAKAKEQQQGDVKIKNKGFSKETAPKASNPIVLTPFMDVWANHVNEMSMYHAFVLPMEDFYRVYNFKTPTSETAATESVEMFIQNAYGKGATKYIDQLLKDLNGGARSDPRESFSKALMSKFKKAAVMASLSVIVQQPTAIVRAMALVDAKYFGPAPITRGLVRTANAKKHKALWNEVKRYAPVAVIKEMGHFDTNMGRSTLDFIKAKEYDSLSEKAKGFFTDSGYRDEVVSKPAALGDELAWVAIWEAVKRETMSRHKDLSPRSEEFLKAVGERFTEVVTKTQVYDSVLARSGNMRSKTAFMNMWTSFMAEPTTSINMVQDALLKGKRGDWRYTAKAIGAVYGSMILNSALVSLVYAMRDDDEDETFAEKYLARLTTEVFDGTNPLTYIPFLKDVWSIMQGYDIERSDMSLITDLVDTLQKTVKVLATDTEGMDEEELTAHEKKVADALWGMVDNISSLAGVPVKNVRRDINGIINLFDTLSKDIEGRQTTIGSLLDKIQADIHSSTPVIGWLPGEKKGDRLYDAVASGDEAYVDRMKDGYASESTYNTALGNAVKERVLDGEIDTGAAADFLEDHAGRTGTEAIADVQYWLYCEEHPELDVSASWFDKYYEYVVGSGMELDAYINYKDSVRDLSLKAEKLPVIDSMPITDAQKDAVYFAEGWKESTLDEAPWHQ